MASPSSLPLPPIKTTTNTLPPAPQLQPQAAGSTPSPYLEIPGAFPHDTYRPSPRQNTSETSRGQSYFPAEPASQLLGTRRTSLPSMEKEGVMPGEHYDGVGPLPGSISETSVAKLPDERMQSAREADQPAQKQKRPAGAGAISLPSRERIGAQPYEHHDGVGPLPGTSSETSVAKLPDERALAAAASSEGRLGTGGGGGTESQKPASDTIVMSENKAPAASAAQKTLNPETGGQNIIPQHPLPAQQVPERVDQGPGVGEAPADSKFKEEDVVKEKKSDLERKEERREGAGEESASLKEQERTKTMPTSEPQTSTVDSPRTQRKGRSGRSSSDSDASHQKKATMMNILKGEMKVLLGRASGNRGRVEEGEKLKQGSH